MIVRVIRHPRAQRLLSAAAVAAAFLLPVLVPHAARAQAVTPAARASQFYEDALQRFEKRDFAGAVVQLRNVLRLDPKNLSAQVLFGRALLSSGQPAAAEVALNEALKLGVSRSEVIVPLARSYVAQGKHGQLADNPLFATAGLPPGQVSQVLLLKGSALAEQGDSRGALKLIEEARSSDAASPDSWMAEVPVRIRERQFAEALAAADRALKIAPDFAEAHYARGSIFHAQGQLQPALKSYDRALALDATHVEALASRAGVLVDLERSAEARRDIEALGKVSGQDPRGWYLKALLDEREGRLPEARAALQQVTELLDPIPIEFLRFRPQVLMLGGLAHHGLSQPEKARPYLEAVQRLQATSPVSKLLAQIYLAEGNVDRAIASLEQYLRGQPGDEQAVLLLATAHQSQGRHARAAQLLADALKRNDNPVLRGQLGLALLGDGKVEAGAQALEAALAKEPGLLQAGKALALLRLQNGQESRAEAVALKLAAQHPRDASVHDLLGSTQAARGKLPAARASFEKALQLDPKLLASRVNLARLDLRTGQTESGVRRLNEVLRTDDKQLEALMLLSAVAEQRGQIAEARQFLEKAADHSGPRELQPALALVDLHLRHGAAADAQAATLRLTSKAPEAMPVLLALARVSLASGNAEQARANLARASRQADYQPALLVQVASLQAQADALPAAAHSLEKALTARPDFLPAMALLGEVELRLGALDRAETRARALVAKHPKAGVGHLLLGDAARQRGNTDAALQHYRRAHALEQSSATLLRQFELLATGNPPAAVALAEPWLRQRPDDVVVRRALANTLARTGQMPAARAAYEQVLKTTPDDAEVLNNLANVMLLQGDAGAVTIAERALALKPSAPHIMGTAGWASFKAGKVDQALKLLRDARLRNPDNAQTRYFLGAVLAQQGRPGEAREELRAALGSKSDFPGRAEAERLLVSLR